MEIIIRNAKENDLHSILAIYNDAVINTTAVYQYKPHTMEMRIEWFADKIKNNWPVFVAENENEITGFATYGPFRAWPAYKYTIEHSVYVHPGYRQQGIAKKLLNQLIENAGQAGLHTIIAGIDSENMISINLHKQFGFEETAHFKEVGYKFGRWLDLKFFQLILPNRLEPKEG